MSFKRSFCVRLDFRSVRNTLSEVFFTLRPTDVIVHRHEDDSVLNILQVCFRFVPLFFEFRGADPVLCPGKIFHSNSIGSPSIPFKS